MSDITVKQFAIDIKIPFDRLLTQLKAANINKSKADDLISDEEKRILLSHLRKSHGKGEKKSTNKISINRNKVTALKQPASNNTRVNNRGRGKTVNVEVRRKRAYTKPPAKRKQTLQEEAEDAKRLLAEQALEREKIEAQYASRDIVETERLKKLAAEREEIEAKKQQIEKEKTDKLAEEAALKAKIETEEKAKKAEKEVAKNAKTAEEERLRIAKENIEAERARKLKISGGVKKPATQNTGRKTAQSQGNSRGRGQKQLKVTGSNRRKKGRNQSRQPEIKHETEHAFQKPVAPAILDVEVPATIAVSELAKNMNIKGAEIVKVLMKMGMMVTITQTLDQDTAALVVEEMGHKVIFKKADDKEADILEEVIENKGKLEPRAPVVTIMGHVDHGKTSLLDYIRKSRVASGEAGGITQHIGAYHVETNKGMISFLDTPGHAAFSQMRSRGAKLTDIIILVVSADDGVMPQTIEAIQHAKASNVPLIVAINKMDKVDANPDKVTQELVAQDVVPDGWGGDTQFIQVSAHTGAGIEELLEAILLQAEILELKASKIGSARGVVVESSVIKGRGAVATILITSGTLKKGDAIACGAEYGRVRAMLDENAKPIKQAGPSIPVQVLGLSGPPEAGDDVIAFKAERKARELAEVRHKKRRETKLAAQKAAQLEEMFATMNEGQINYVHLVIKADTQGSVEAIKESLLKLSTDEVKVKIVGSGVGGINDSDVNLAVSSDSVIFGFNVRADNSAKTSVAEQGIDLRYYSIIYELIDDVKKAMSGLLSPEVKEEIIGLAEVKDVFRSSKLGAVAGSIVIDGTVRKQSPIRVLRDNVVIYEGVLESLRRFKDDVNEVKAGTECGIAVKDYNDIKAGDQIEVFDRVEVERNIT